MGKRKYLFQHLCKKETEIKKHIFRQSCLSSVKSNNFSSSFFLSASEYSFFFQKKKKKYVWHTNYYLPKTRQRNGGKGKKILKELKKDHLGMRNFFTEPIIITLSGQTELNLKTKYYFAFSNIIEKRERHFPY